LDACKPIVGDLQKKIRNLEIALRGGLKEHFCQKKKKDKKQQEFY